jgi:hypothetical protein
MNEPGFRNHYLIQVIKSSLYSSPGLERSEEIKTGERAGIVYSSVSQRIRVVDHFVLS